MLASEFAKQEDEDLKSLVEDQVSQSRRFIDRVRSGKQKADGQADSALALTRQFEGGLSYTTECKGCKTKSDRPSKFLELELNMTVRRPKLFSAQSVDVPADTIFAPLPAECKARGEARSASCCRGVERGQPVRPGHTFLPLLG